MACCPSSGALNPYLTICGACFGLPKSINPLMEGVILVYPFFAVVVVSAMACLAGMLALVEREINGLGFPTDPSSHLGRRWFRRDR